ncbi:MAG: hypothetical protein J5795_00640 [Lachnospiraceae bacterium]|nr:hypothetical protein [Lachnospiraceae bacterium]MBO7631716.1 hypothetical protein [Lachnospiraceae bacterium]
MKNLTKLAILATIAGGAYYLYKQKNEQKVAEVAVDDDELFEGDFDGAEAAAEDEAAPKKFDIYKQKASELAKKTAEKASDFAKVVAEKAGEAKDYVGKKVEEYKNRDAAEEVEEAAEEIAEEAADAVEEVVEDFKPSDDPVDPEA